MTFPFILETFHEEHGGKVPGVFIYQCGARLEMCMIKKNSGHNTKSSQYLEHHGFTFLLSSSLETFLFLSGKSWLGGRGPRILGVSDKVLDPSKNKKQRQYFVHTFRVFTDPPDSHLWSSNQESLLNPIWPYSTFLVCLPRYTTFSSSKKQSTLRQKWVLTHCCF